MINISTTQNNRAEKNRASSEDHVFDIPEFTKEMKKTYTILSPDIFPLHMQLIKQIFRAYGYNFEVLKCTGQEVIDTGLKYIHNDMCYPAICLAGQLIYALNSGKYDINKCALILFQTGGGCRASNYIWLTRKALRNMGYGHIPILSMSLSKVEKSSGFKVPASLILKGIISIVYGDMLMLLRNQVRPYEKNKGEADKLVNKWIDYLTDKLCKNKEISPHAVKKNLRSIAHEFSLIEKNDVKKTKVGIVGEIYVKYSQFGNNGLEDFLSSQDCEFMVPGVLGFFQFMFDNRITDYNLYGGKKSKKYLSKVALYVINRIEKTMHDVLKEYPQFIAPTPFKKVRALGEKVIGLGMRMGEGWLLPAETAELIEKGYNNIICAQPFGCLPNHIAGKGVIRTLRNMYPKANICPVDFDAGASKVNQENRIKLMLAVAREADL